MLRASAVLLLAALAACSGPVPPPDPCAAASCGAHASCTVDGSTATCACDDGYTGDGRTCSVEDPCARTSCPAHASCRGADGVATCDCDGGFTLTEGACVDVDECAGATACGEHEVCRNTEGAFECPCREGYSRRDGACEDVDECAVASVCGAHETCANAPGSFACTCVTGYERAASGACENVDECASAANACSPFARCEDTEGGYECACLAGLRGDGRTCVALYAADADEAVLRRIDPDTGWPLQAVWLARVDGGTLLTVTGLTTHPITGEMWGLADDANGGRWLARIDPASGDVTPIGAAPTDPALSALAFTGDGALFGLSGADGGGALGGHPHAVFAIDATNGVATVLATLSPEPPDGTGLAWNPEDGALYAAIGAGELNAAAGLRLARIALDGSVTPIPLAGSEELPVPGEATGLAWDPGLRAFLLGGARDGFSVTPAGAISARFQLPWALSSIAFALPRLVDECAAGVITCQEGTACVDRPFGTDCACPTCGPRTCAEVKARQPDAPSGIYALDLSLVDGTTIDAFCDMEFAGGGWTLIMREKRLDAATEGVPGGELESLAHLSVVRMRGLAGLSHELAIREAASRDVNFVRTLPDTVPIENMRRGRSPYYAPAEFSTEHWVGGGAGADLVTALTFSCGGATDYPIAIYWACNNGNGLHWNQLSARWNLATSEHSAFELWFR